MQFTVPSIDEVEALSRRPSMSMFPPTREQAPPAPRSAAERGETILKTMYKAALNRTCTERVLAFVGYDEHLKNYLEQMDLTQRLDMSEMVLVGDRYYRRRALEDGTCELFLQDTRVLRYRNLRRDSAFGHDHDKCPICLQSIKTSCVVACMRGHRFHRRCLKSWFDHCSSNNVALTCPKCKDKNVLNLVPCDEFDKSKEFPSYRPTERPWKRVNILPTGVHAAGMASVKGGSVDLNVKIIHAARKGQIISVDEPQMEFHFGSSVVKSKARFTGTVENRDGIYATVKIFLQNPFKDDRRIHPCSRDSAIELAFLKCCSVRSVRLMLARMDTIIMVREEVTGHRADKNGPDSFAMEYEDAVKWFTEEARKNTQEIQKYCRMMAHHQFPMNMWLIPINHIERKLKDILPRPNALPRRQSVPDKTHVNALHILRDLMKKFQVKMPSRDERAKLFETASNAVDRLLKTEEGRATLRSELRNKRLPMDEVARRVKKMWAKPWIGFWITDGKKKNTMRLQMRLERFLKLMKPHLSFGVNGSLPSRMMGVQSGDEVRVGPDFSNGFMHTEPQAHDEPVQERPLFVQMREPHDLPSKNYFMDGFKLADGFDKETKQYKKLLDALMVSNHYSKRMMVRIMHAKPTEEDKGKLGSAALCSAFLNRSSKERSMLDSIQEESCALLLTAPRSPDAVVYPAEQPERLHPYKFTNLFEWEYVPYSSATHEYATVDGKLSKMTLAQMLPHAHCFRSDPTKAASVIEEEHDGQKRYQLPSWCVHELMFTGAARSGLSHDDDMKRIFEQVGQIHGLPELKVKNFEKLKERLSTSKIRFPAEAVMKVLTDAGYHGSLSTEELLADPSRLHDVENADFVSTEEVRKASRHVDGSIEHLNAITTDKEYLIVSTMKEEPELRKNKLFALDFDDWQDVSNHVGPIAMQELKKIAEREELAEALQSILGDSVKGSPNRKQIEKDVQQLVLKDVKDRRRYVNNMIEHAVWRENLIAALNQTTLVSSLGKVKNWIDLEGRLTPDLRRSILLRSKPLDDTKRRLLASKKSRVHLDAMSKCGEVPVAVDSSTVNELKQDNRKSADITRILLDRFRTCQILRRDGYYGQQFGLSYVTSDLGPDANADKTHEKFMAHGIALNTTSKKEVEPGFQIAGAEGEVNRLKKLMGHMNRRRMVRVRPLKYAVHRLRPEMPLDEFVSLTDRKCIEILEKIDPTEYKKLEPVVREALDFARSENPQSDSFTQAIQEKYPNLQKVVFKRPPRDERYNLKLNDAVLMLNSRDMHSTKFGKYHMTPNEAHMFDLTRDDPLLPKWRRDTRPLTLEMIQVGDAVTLAGWAAHRGQVGNHRVDDESSNVTRLTIAQANEWASVSTSEALYGHRVCGHSSTERVTDASRVFVPGTRTRIKDGAAKDYKTLGTHECSKAMVLGALRDVHGKILPDGEYWFGGRLKGSESIDDGCVCAQAQSVVCTACAGFKFIRCFLLNTEESTVEVCSGRRVGSEKDGRLVTGVQDGRCIVEAVLKSFTMINPWSGECRDVPIHFSRRS